MTDTLMAPVAATAPAGAGAAVVVEADGRTASNDALHTAIDEAVRRGAPLRVLTTWGSRHRAMYDASAVAERDRLSQAQLERRLARALKRSPDLDVQCIDGYDSAAEYLAAHPDSAQVVVLAADNPESAGLQTVLAASGCAVLTCDRRHRL
ncbi:MULTISPECIES: universal stress protein [Mycolicibacterium]|uniref:UspA protein n=1 Tax=Mycolicibacterium senegalense TaxID=1796 RepID=A0A378SX60_9MYCO|nr:MULTISPECIES: universal stress protein [Mycolicibacterium]MCV7334638.1 universal stress protein [Mycolicibacterium senegalense]MDR7291891.1 nucleotide-binding universal stress UspA family protein [Mycolicibacterium senegalense]QZA23323.1 universal stress protein [Mycolicibacterium senegalense]CDP89719.1 universal stress protein family protein [Mycolicibacterium farcinogenes]STZ53109.1 UspA protein [Mycolicibacterium senegalense]